ncbi:NAD-dependent epimerase/dehydratase family protein (plasmid) [Mesorhizobium sp. AaZ16]|uniref:NAD-dependent epimerase/dehydratase family protein n=1 Tax=Mesorhizobium sp. AaZ16 TaxID=3402289 RepID=UPI00374EAA45
MSQQDRVVIIGGTGFIGQHLVSQLRGNVQSITVVSRSSAAYASNETCHYTTGDVADGDRMLQVLKGASVVYYLALTMEDDFGVGARNVAVACLRHGIRRLIFASSTDALYLGRNGSIDERAGADPKPHLRNPYSRGKVKSEKVLLELHAAHALPVVILRPGLVVGRGGKLAHGGMGTWKTPTGLLGWGNGNNPLPFVLVQDVAAAMALTMDAADVDGQAFNLGGDVFLSAREYVRLASEKTLRDFRFYPQSLWRLYAIALAKSAIKWVLRRSFERQTYRDMVSQGMYSQIDNRAAKELLGWKPNADLQVFIREAIEIHAEPIPKGDLRLGP